MKLYQTPGGTWAGNEKDYKAVMKAEGIDPKTVTRKQVDVPTDKAGLMEFLTFHNVNCINPRAVPAPEVAGSDLPPSTPQSLPAAPTTVSDLDAAFTAAPLRKQAELAVGFIDRLVQ